MTKAIDRENEKRVLNEFLTAVKDRIKMPKKVDWDEIYYSQFSD